MKNFRDLDVWQKAHDLCRNIYRVTAAFPRDEIYSMTSQMRRSAISIPTNVAEGCGRRTEREFAQFVNIALGSASELEYLLLLSRDVALLSGSDYEVLTAATCEVKRMLTGLMKRLRLTTN